MQTAFDISTDEALVDEVIHRRGPRAAFDQLIAENNALIRSPTLDNGRRLASARSAIYWGLVRHWAEAQQRLQGYHKPFAVVALGGTGRAEMAPCSDTDFALLFEDAVEGNPFLLELQTQVLHTQEFVERYGFEGPVLPFALEDVPQLAEKQLNSFLDLRPVYDPEGLAERFRERIRATFNPFEHFLHVRGFWKDQWEKAAAQSERLDRFDIKNDGLRLFLAGIWTLAGRDFVHSHDIYRTLEDPRDLAAYEFLLRIRAFIHLRRPSAKQVNAGGNHPEDVLGFDDFISFGEMLGSAADARTRFEFATQVRARLLSARRRVARYAKSVIERELKNGREVSLGSPIKYGAGGLIHATVHVGDTPVERSRAVLSLLLTAQRYGVPVDGTELQTTFAQAGDWLIPVPELAALFHEQRGSLADTCEFLSQLDGAEDRLFPGYAKFEASLDERVMTERKSLRSALERQKTRILERFVREGRTRLAQAVSKGAAKDFEPQFIVALEAARLDADQLAAVKLALKTKRLPLTARDLALRRDETRELHERFSTGFSDIPLAEYYEPYAMHGGFSPETLRLVEFLVGHHRAFKEFTAVGINDRRQVLKFAELCRDEHRLRALFVFTHADHAEWESAQSKPARWFNTRDLYVLTMREFRPDSDPARVLLTGGFSPDQLDVLKDFGESLFSGSYRFYTNRFAAHLLRLVEEPEQAGPKAIILRDSGATIVGVAARDFRGLAATISGALWHQKIELTQAHLFSAMNHGLALDFFHVLPRDQALPADLTRNIEDAIQRQQFIGEADAAHLPTIVGQATLREWRPGQFCLRFETAQDSSGLIYALTYKIFRHLGGNIFGLSAQTSAGSAFVSVYLSLPKELSIERAEAITANCF